MDISTNRESQFSVAKDWKISLLLRNFNFNFAVLKKHYKNLHTLEK